jgi:hypothetical protein
MNQGPRRISLIEKKEGQKSRGTIPLMFCENVIVISMLIPLLFCYGV